VGGRDGWDQCDRRSIGSRAPPADDDRRTGSAAIAGRLAAELGAGRVDQEELAVLRDELGTDVTGRFEVKLERLQSRVATFDAYIDAMEAFIDEYGTGDEVLADVYPDSTTSRTR
jgi:hypothetical protein